MAKQNSPVTMDIGDPDFLPPQLISGGTPEERDGEVCARIKDALIKIMNSMGDLPAIAEGAAEPNIEVMEQHYQTLGVLLLKLRQRLDDRLMGEEEEEAQPAPVKGKGAGKKKPQGKKANIANEFD